MLRECMSAGYCMNILFCLNRAKNIHPVYSGIEDQNTKFLVIQEFEKP